MNEQQQEYLEALRNAARQDQWNLCRESLAKLLPSLTETVSIGIVVRLAQRFLADISHAHPEDEPLGKTIEALNNVTSLEARDQQGQLNDPILNQYWNEPG